MRVNINPEQRELFTKLARLAKGDIDLVQHAIRACSKDAPESRWCFWKKGGKADLADVVKYILSHQLTQDFRASLGQVPARGLPYSGVLSQIGNNDPEVLRSVFTRASALIAAGGPLVYCKGDDGATRRQKDGRVKIALGMALEECLSPPL
ncbi:MAG: hypothetical protein LRY36_02360 [Alphaproteobacteria bacterium]|nr:hypothetical protein [Alphaproteobacteria bacterium]